MVRSTPSTTRDRSTNLPQLGKVVVVALVTTDSVVAAVLSIDVVLAALVETVVEVLAGIVEMVVVA